METIKTIESSVNELVFAYYNEEKDELVKIDGDSKITQKQLQSAMCFLVEEIKRTVFEDLRDVWNRLDRMKS